MRQELPTAGQIVAGESEARTLFVLTDRLYRARSLQDVFDAAGLPSSHRRGAGSALYYLNELWDTTLAAMFKSNLGRRGCVAPSQRL
jgi:hypothetical protein